MITFDVSVTIKVKRALRPISEHIDVSESIAFSYTKTSGSGYTSIPTVGDVQFLVLWSDRNITVRFNGQTDAGLPLNAGGVLVVKGTNCSSVLIDNSSGSDATIQGIVGGDGGLVSLGGAFGSGFFGGSQI